MVFRLLYEGAVGLFTFIAILLFGEKGYSVFALLALLPFIWRALKIKPDERELQLFYQTNNWALILTLLSLVAIYEFSDVSVAGHIIGNYWMPLSIAATFIARGIVGLIIFKTH